MKNAISINNISKSFQGFQLNNVTLQVPKGSVMGLIGENGAGKTTLMKLILGLQHPELLDPSKASLTVLDCDSLNLSSAVKENIGVVFDDSCFPENLTAIQIDRFMKGIYKQWDSSCFNGYLEYFNLPAKKVVKDFSKGMKAKLSIAAAMSHDAKLLILDEPTAGLDPIVREEILDVFMNFMEDEEHSILISSHITGDLEKICDYVTFIHGGKILLSDEKDKILLDYGILKCSEEQFKEISPSFVRGYTRSSFGISALVERNKINGNYTIDPASLEDILLYSVRGK